MQNGELKLRKSLNISIQSKRYYIPINEIITEWEEQGLSLSTKVCETLLLGYRLSNSVELSKLVNTFEMISKTLSHYYNEENTEEYMKAIENVFNKVITVDGETLSEFLSNPIRYSNSENASQVVKKHSISEPQKEVVTKTKNEVIPQTEKTNSVNEIAVSNEMTTNIKDTTYKKEASHIQENNMPIIQEASLNSTNEDNSYEVEETKDEPIELNDNILFNL